MVMMAVSMTVVVMPRMVVAGVGVVVVAGVGVMVVAVVVVAGVSVVVVAGVGVMVVAVFRGFRPVHPLALHCVSFYTPPEWCNCIIFTPLEWRHYSLTSILGVNPYLVKSRRLSVSVVRYHFSVGNGKGLVAVRATFVATQRLRLETPITKGLGCPTPNLDRYSYESYNGWAGFSPLLLQSFAKGMAACRKAPSNLLKRLPRPPCGS